MLTSFKIGADGGLAKVAELAVPTPAAICPVNVIVSDAAAGGAGAGAGAGGRA
jgi:hypothetical protein